MKKLLYIFLLFGTVSFNSCSEWLDENPETSYDIDDIEGEAAIRSLLVGAYASMRGTYNLDRTIGIVGTDICRAGKVNVNTVNLDLYTLNSSLAVVEKAWINSYSAIQSCNIVINRARLDRTLDEITRNNIVAQARFMRAFSYFKMVQWFGALPLVTDETAAYDQLILSAPRADVSDVYDLIISDLLYAGTEGILADKPVDAAVTRFAAKALLGKVDLTMGTSKARLEHNPALKENEVLAQYEKLPKSPNEYYRLAYNVLLEVIDKGGFKLVDNYGDLFSIETSKKFTNGESLWEIPYSSQRGYGSQWSKQFGASIIGGSTYSFNAMGGIQNYQPVPSFWSYYTKGDVRRRWNLIDQKVKYVANDPQNPVSLESHNIPDETLGVALEEVYKGNISEFDINTGIGCGKYRWGTGDPETMWSQLMSFSADNCPNNVVVLRYADVLLMFVEADMLLNGAGPHDLTSQGASATALRIMNEQILYRARGCLTEKQMLERSTDTWGDRYLIGPDGEYLPVSENDRSKYLLDFNDETNPLTFGALIRERARELCFEFHRWNDLVRWGILETAYASRISSAPNGTVSVNNYLFPIPLRELQAARDNEAFYKNPGY